MMCVCGCACLSAVLILRSFAFLQRKSSDLDVQNNYSADENSSGTNIGGKLRINKSFSFLLARVENSRALSRVDKS